MFGAGRAEGMPGGLLRPCNTEKESSRCEHLALDKAAARKEILRISKGNRMRGLATTLLASNFYIN